MKTTIEKMEDANARLKELADQLAGEQDDAQRTAIEKMIDGKRKEFSDLEKAYAREEEQAARDAKLAELAGKKKEAEGKAATLTEPKAEVTDGEHNATNFDMEHTSAFTRYFSEGKSALADIAGKRGENFVNQMKPNREGSKNAGLRLPVWMAKYCLPQSRSDQVIEDTWGKTFDRAERLQGKSSLFVREASGTNSGGGSAVAVDFESSLYKLPAINDDIPQSCWVKSAVGKEADFPKLGQGTYPFGIYMTEGNAGAANGEGTSLTQSDPVLSQVQVTLERIAGLSKCSNRFLRVNDIGYEAELAWMFRGAFYRKLSELIVSGGHAFVGVNTNAAISAGVSVRAREGAGAITYVDLVKLAFDVDESLLDRVKIYLRSGSSGALAHIASKDGSQGEPIMTGIYTGWGTARPGTIQGFEYKVSPVLPTLGNRGDAIAGDWMQYGLAIDQMNAAIERSDERYFDSGEIGFRMIVYAGGVPLGYSAFAVLGDVSTASSSSSSSS